MEIVSPSKPEFWGGGMEPPSDFAGAGCGKPENSLAEIQDELDRAHEKNRLKNEIATR